MSLQLWCICLYSFCCVCDMYLMSHITVVSIVNKLWSGWLGFKSWQEQVTFIFAITSKLVLGPTRFPIHWAPGSSSHSAEVAVVWCLLLTLRLRTNGRTGNFTCTFCVFIYQEFVQWFASSLCHMIIGCVHFRTSLLYMILFHKILMTKLHFKLSQILEYVHSLHGLLFEIQENAGYSISGNV
jgi:hypothetical protein